MTEPATNNENPVEIADSEPKKPSPNGSKIERLKSWYIGNKKIALPATLLVLVLVLAAVPFSRYAIAGTVIKKDLAVKVLDDTAATPVSGAIVSSGGVTAETNGAGLAVLKHVKVGKHSINVSKKYYKDKTLKVTVPIIKQKKVASIQVTATGRQVRIQVTNAINKSALKDAEILAAGTTAKTDSNGSAILVLPADINEQKATISLEGYNDAEVTLKISADKLLDNQASLTPSGKVYFLSKLSGKIDVVKTNLDGTGRQTVLPGTGNEEDTNTVLLASRDWKYLALLSRRAGSSASVYMIDTSNDSLTTIDEGSASFDPVGWTGDDFIYTVSRASVQLWQPGRQLIKSFDAAAKKTTVLDQTAASGSGSFDYLTELIGSVYAYDNQVYYVKNWSAAYNGTSLSELQTKQATFNSVKPDGSAKKAIRSFGQAAGTQAADINLDEQVKSPGDIELHFYDGQKDNFYTYSNGQVKSNTAATNDNFFSTAYPTYLLSPSGSDTFWSEPRDGKNTLFLGDEDGQNQKQIATLSDYNTYGWYTDNYLLVSKNSSELYIMDKSGKQAAVKVSDYHKPARSFNGYGGGYGGL